MRECTRVCSAAMFLSAALFLALAFAFPLSLLSQTASKRPESRQNATENPPEWNMSDEEFKSLLLQIEAILPIYESTLKDVDTYLIDVQGLPYQEGKMIQGDLKGCRFDLANIHKTISSLKEFRYVIEEIDLRIELIQLESDTYELQNDELNAPLVEMNPRIRFPNPTGFGASNEELAMPTLKLAWDYVARIRYLESRTSKCNMRH